MPKTDPAPRRPKQEQEPAGAAVTEVAPDVLRMQLPISLPGLGHVNMYALVDGDGVTLVDPGLPGPSSWRALRSRLADAGIPLRRVHTVVITHSHPDHFGGAGRLADQTGAAILTHERFNTWWLPHSHRDASDDAHDHTPGAAAPAPPPAPREVPPFGGPTPWGGKGHQVPLKRRLVFKAMRSRLGRHLFAAPVPTRRVAHGDTVRLARRDWVAVHTPGHTVDHLCLHDPEHGLLLSGDHVLPTITPHISGLSTGPDPLDDFLSSLDLVAALDGVGTVLPAHGHPFGDLAGRAAAIRAHHEERLTKLEEVSAAIGPATVEELSHHLFRPARWGAMAESETYAHLEHLRLAGRARRTEVGGRAVYAVDA